LWRSSLYFVKSPIGQEVITTTSDKIRICLMNYDSEYKSKNRWQTPLGVLLALIPSLVAAEFKDFLGLSASVWQAIFVVGSILCAAYLVHSLRLAYKFRSAGDIECLIKKLKNG